MNSKKNSGGLGIFKKILGYVSLVVMFTIIIFAFSNLRTTKVDGESMNPTLENGQTIWVNIGAYVNEEPKIGDIVVAKYISDEESDKRIVKRVAGLPNDKIEFKDGVFYRNEIPNPDIELSEEDEDRIPKGEIELGDGEFYLLGDNIPESSDSREMGTFDSSDLFGKVLFE